MNKTYQEQAAAGKKWCYDCEHYRSSSFCGYGACSCVIHGSLDQDQHERHPDRTADVCPDYKSNEGKPWYEKYK